MAGREFLTMIEIDAPVARAWDVLTDFADFGEWCPTLRAVAGAAAVGTGLKLRLAAAPGADRTLGLSATVRVVDPPKELAWGGGFPGAPWLLDVHHWFRLEPLASERCRLHHGERFRGLLRPLLWWAIATRVEAGYPAFNLAFKARCEAPRESR